MSTPADLARDLRRIEPALARGVKRLGKFAFTRIGGAVVGRHMRPGPGGAVHPTKLTSRSGTLAGSYAGKGFGGRGRRFAIEEVRQTGPTSWTIEKGSNLPYAAIHEYGGRAGRGGSAVIPPRPALLPAFKDETPAIAREAEAIFHDELTKELKA